MMLLAPMANVTDTAFRQIIARCGRPDLMMTEFTSCEGLCSRGRERLLAELTYHESERPLVVQYFGRARSRSTTVHSSRGSSASTASTSTPAAPTGVCSGRAPAPR